MFTEYSPYWLVVIVLLAAGITYFAYFFRKRNDFQPWQRNVLSALRFVSLLMIMFLLLSPIVKITKHITEKPIIVIAQDDSESLVAVSDSAYYRTDYQKALLSLADELKKDFDVRIVGFGSKIKTFEQSDEKHEFAFDQSETDIASCISYIEQEYFNSNLSAIILASDGINNHGNNPLNECEKIRFPIYTIALGDTAKRQDFVISNVRCNKIAYLDDEFPIEITFNAEKADGQQAKVRLYQGKKLLMEELVNVKGEKFSITLPTTAIGLKPGVQRFRAEVSHAKNETNKDNNVREFFVEILDSRQNILMLSAVPHPDLSAIKQCIEKNKNYSLEMRLFSEKSQMTNRQTDLVIAHQLPCDKGSYDYLSKIQQAGIPILYILGSKSDYALFNKLNTGLIVNLYNNKTKTDAQASFNPDFALFSLNEQSSVMIKDFPPLNAPLARFVVSPGTQTLAYQYIAGAKSEYPLLCFTNNPQQKNGIVCGENIWRWRMQNYLMNQSHEQADEIINKSIRYLVSSADKSLFRVNHDNVFNQGREIHIEAELYNESYQLINTPEVQISIKDNEGKDYNYTFAKTASAYFLNAGVLPQGDYRYTAKTSLAGKSYSAQGSFVVSETMLERINLVADHTLLKTISQKTGGQMLYAKEMERLLEVIKGNEYIKPIIRTETTNKKLIENIWYWLAIVLTLSGEWFLRKYWGRV